MEKRLTIEPASDLAVNVTPDQFYYKPLPAPAAA